MPKTQPLPAPSRHSRTRRALRRSVLTLCSMLVLVLPVKQTLAEDSEKNNENHVITVLADQSMTVPISLIARRYSQDRQIAVSTVFSSTNHQIKQVEEGMEAHVLIASKPIWIEKMQEKGLIDVYSRTPIARNQLVIAHNQKNARTAYSASGSDIRQKLPLGNDEFQLAVGDPEFLSEGTYAFEALMRLGLLGELEAHLSVFKTLSEMTNATVHHDAYSIMFKSDVVSHPHMDIISVFPSGSYQEVLYQAVVVAGGNMNGAREFLSYLRSDEAREILSNFGFDSVQ